MQNAESTHLVAVDVGLEWTLDVEAKVFGLDGSELAQLNIDVLKMQKSDLLIENLGKHVNADIELASLAELNVLGSEVSVATLVQVDLSKDLICERAGHDEGRMAGGTSKIDKAAFGEENDVVAGGKDISVDLRLDVGDALVVGLEPSNVDFNVKVTNVYQSG
jgi:hypothetical protein